MFHLLKLKFFIVNIALQLIVIKSNLYDKNFCPNNEIYRIGIKSVCEYSFRRRQVSCLDPIQSNTRALISCRYGYSNKQNITEQKIECTSSGRWSTSPFQCDDICEEQSIGHKIDSKESWFIEMKGTTTSCSSIILNAKLLLANANCVLPYRPEDLLLETGGSDSQILVVKMIHYDNNKLERYGGKYHKDAFAIIELENNIIYDPHVRSVCVDFRVQEYAKQRQFISAYLERFKPSKTLDYAYIKNSCSFEYLKSQIQYDDNNIELECFLADRKISCDQDLEQGAIIKFRCKLGYEKENLESTDEIKCISEGKWDREVNLQCVLICGQYGIKTPNKIALISNGTPINIYNTPWHVAIYKNFTNAHSYQQICGGTIIHSNVVVSAAHCFDNIPKNKIDYERNFMVASGKRFRDFDSAESTTQFSRIQKIHVPSTYNVNYERHDIAVLELETHLQYDNFTRPACIEWSSYGEYDIKAGKQGLVAGWGATSPTNEFSPELLAMELTTLNNEECKNLAHPNHRKQITGEKFCALGYKNTSACKGDSGGGFLLKKPYNYDGDRYYLWGVVSYGIDPSKHCTSNFLTTYTNIQYHQDIIKSVIEKNLNANNNKSILDQTSLISEYLEKYRPTEPEYNYHVRKSCNLEEVFIQQNFLKFDCFVGQSKISCDETLNSGSSLKIYCESGYEKTNHESPDEIECNFDGKWSGKVDHQCSFVCGKIDVENQSLVPLVFKGTPIDIVNVPWHIGIYKNKKGTGAFDAWCGGTLIQPNVVISAAHCFIEETYKQYPLSEFFVASGKRYRKFESFERYSQFSRIKKVYVPYTYNITYYQHDISVVILEQNLLFNSHTRPACIEWFSNGNYNLEANKTGVVAGWGAISPSNDYSPELLSIELTSISNERCKILTTSRTNDDEISNEKFCAIAANGGTICQGDDGSGFLLKKQYNGSDERFYLWGVVSSGVNIAEHCTSSYITTYTNIQYEQKFLKAAIGKYINLKT